jgi:hypothetical protein
MLFLGFGTELAFAGTNDQPVRLEASVGTVKASGTSLSDVINQIQTNSGNQILVNWAALKEVHVTQQLPVTIDISNLPTKKALAQLLDAVGGTHVKLDYTTDGDAISVTTAAELAKNVVTRVYDIQVALKADPSREHAVAAAIRRVRGIDPLSWRDAGGDHGSVSELGGYLIVVQTPQMQDRIADEIKDLAPAGN